MSILYKPLTDAEAMEGINSVEPLNKEIERRLKSNPNIHIIAWASDMHLHPIGGYSFNFGGNYQYIDCTRQYSLCLHEINALVKRPDSIVLGGDITEMGLEAEWMEFSRIMDLNICNIPTIPVFGNHEHIYLPPQEEMEKIWQKIRQPGWPDLANSKEFYFSAVVNGIKYIIIDTIRGTEKFLSDEQKEFLARELEEKDYKTIIFQHGHIMNSGNWTDGALFLDRDMINMINNSPQVLGVFSGHTHKQSLWHYKDKLYGTFPSVAYSIGPCTGWGGILVDDEGIQGVFYKELYGESYDDCIGHRFQEGKFEFLEAKSYERDPLCSPFFWGRNPDPSKRK